MSEWTAEELAAVITAAHAHAAAQQEEQRRLEAELPLLNQRLGAARRRQEYMQRPSTLVTEAGKQRIQRWLVRLRPRRPRRPSP